MSLSPFTRGPVIFSVVRFLGFSLEPLSLSFLDRSFSLLQIYVLGVLFLFLLIPNYPSKFPDSQIFPPFLLTVLCGVSSTRYSFPFIMSYPPGFPPPFRLRFPALLFPAFIPLPKPSTPPCKDSTFFFFRVSIFFPNSQRSPSHCRPKRLFFQTSHGRKAISLYSYPSPLLPNLSVSIFFSTSFPLKFFTPSEGPPTFPSFRIHPAGP